MAGRKDRTPEISLDRRKHIRSLFGLAVAPLLGLTLIGCESSGTKDYKRSNLRRKRLTKIKPDR